MVGGTRGATAPEGGSRSSGEAGAWLVVGAFLALAALEAHGRAHLVPPTPPRAHVSPPDPAHSGARDLRRIPGVGPWLALEIQRRRWEEGGLETLEAVPGIGPRLSETIEAWLDEQGARAQASRRGRGPEGE